MKSLNSIETTFVKGSLRYKGAPEIGLKMDFPLLSKEKELEEYDRNVIVNLADLYNKERQKSTKFIPSAKFQFIFENRYSGLTNGSTGQVYTPFNGYMYFVNEEYFRTQSVINNGEQIEIPWGGFPDYNEFAFYRTDYNSVGYTSGENKHINFLKRDAGSYNWNIHVTYAFSNDSTVQMGYDKDGVNVPFICGDGIPYVMSLGKYQGRDVIFFECPVNHGLSVGENLFEVFSLGNGYYNSEYRIFTVLNIGYNIPQKFFPQRQGTFKRVLSPDLTGETTSQYYVRIHKNLTHQSATTITNTGFEQNAFRLVQKLTPPAAQPNIANPSYRISTKEGSQSYNVSFKDIIDI